MFLGHFAVGLGAKPLAPRVSLGSLFLAAQWLDLLWPTLLLLGVERVRIDPAAGPVTPLVFEHYPVSHSLLAVALWALLAGALHLALRRDRRAALVLGALVLSHWLLDLLVHAPDLPLWPAGGPRLGLHAWASLPLTLALELTLFGLGAVLYARATTACDAQGRWGLWGLLAFLLAIQAGNLFGEPPPSAQAIAWVGQAQWLLILWGYWLDRHRRPRQATPAPQAGRAHLDLTLHKE